MAYTVFSRTWWGYGPTGELVPEVGDRTILHEDVETADEARALCRDFNEENDPGIFGLKAEFESD